MNQGFPGQHTTATSVTVGTTAVNPSIRYDPRYITTLPGILRAAEVILNILGFICVVSTTYEIHSTGKWFNTVAMSGFWISGILLSFYIFHIVEKLHKIPWLKIEFIYCGIWMICNLIAGIFISTLASYAGALCAAAVFGFSAMVVYGVDGWLKYTAWKRGDMAQGIRQPNKTVSSNVSPAY